MSEAKETDNPGNSQASPSVWKKIWGGPRQFRRPKESQIWKSIFRHKLDDTPRNRALAILTNVFLHVHPPRINRDAVRCAYTPSLHKKCVSVTY